MVHYQHGPPICFRSKEPGRAQTIGISMRMRSASPGAGFLPLLASGASWKLPVNAERSPVKVRRFFVPFAFTALNLPAPLIFPAVNRAAGFEVRSVEYMHWWTFLGFFMEIRDTTYATVLGLRQKKYGKHRKKLEKHEQEFWKNNASICELKPRYTEEELAEQEALKSILGG